MTVLSRAFWGIVMIAAAVLHRLSYPRGEPASLISKLAPGTSKGTAMGVYNTSQSLGFLSVAWRVGFLSHYAGQWSVFRIRRRNQRVWLVLAASMKNAPAVRTRMFHIEAGCPPKRHANCRAA